MKYILLAIGAGALIKALVKEFGKYVDDVCQSAYPNSNAANDRGGK